MTKWTIREIEKLLDLAGVFALEDIARQLDKTTEQVDNACLLLDLPVEVSESAPFWCDTCATWRTVKHKNANCKVCAIKENIQSYYDKEAEELNSMAFDKRVTYYEFERMKGDRLRRPPKLTGDYIEDERLEIEYYTAVYCRHRTFLKRLRITNGTNPKRGK